MLSQAERMLRSITDLHVAPSSVTTASLADSLAAATRKIIRPQHNPNFLQFNSLLVVASELGNFLPAYENSYMNLLTKLYDGETYEERRRTGKVNHLKIDQTLLSILGGTTPSYLNSFLPEGAWDQGFTSRTIFVFEGVPIRTSIFSEEEEFTVLERAYVALLNDIKLIAAMSGKITWTQEAMAAITEWDRKDLPPVPQHGKLTHYNTRRLAHCLKLCMVASVARSSDMLITLEDYQTAWGWLTEAEEFMPDIFKSMGTSADARAMEDCWYLIYQMYSKQRRPVFENILVDFLRNRVASHQITKIIEIMVKAKMIRMEIVQGLPAYVPEEKKT